MSGYYNNNPDLDETERQDNGGGGLRKQLEDALKEIKELRAELSNDKRSANVTDLLRGKGIDPAVAELIPADQDPAAWVEKYSHLLGVKEKPELLEEAPDHKSPQVVGIEQDDPAIVAEREALAAMQDAADSGSPASVAPDALEKMNKINSEEEFWKFISANGAPGAF